tara:strand:- start:1450 stop:1947 length:498 start_codon:yes stop_codon:yes gene_type:complete
MKNNNFNIEEKDNLFIFSNKDYEIYHKSDNLNLGYKEFEVLLNKKKKFFDENNININNTKNDNQNNIDKHTIKNQILSNFIRSAFLIGTFVVIAFITSMLISSVIKKNEIKGGKQFWKNFENEIVKFSEKEIDIESQNKIIISLRKIGEKYKPFLNEIGFIFEKK